MELLTAIRDARSAVLVRMIQIEMTGRFVDADARQIIRSVGQPNQDGKCQLSSGMLVATY